MLPPGRASPEIKPLPTGSATFTKTIGIVCVSRTTALKPDVVETTITSTFRVANAQRYSTDELMKSYEVIGSIVERHSQSVAAKILTLNLATCITADPQRDERAALARLADSIRTLCNAVTDIVKEDPAAVGELLKGRTQKLN